MVFVVHNTLLFCYMEQRFDHFEIPTHVYLKNHAFTNTQHKACLVFFVHFEKEIDKLWISEAQNGKISRINHLFIN